MADEFVQQVKITVDDGELVAAIRRMREAFGDSAHGSTRNPASGLEKGMEKAGKAAGETARQTQNIAKATKDATRETNGLTSAFDRMKGAVTGLVAAYAGFKGISALVGFGKGSIESFNVQNRAERMLQFGMRQNGTTERFAELKKFASLIQQNTMYGDEAMLSAAAGWQNAIRGVDNSKRMMALVADYAAKSTGGGAVGADQMRGFSQQLMQALRGRAISLKAQGLDITPIEQLNEIRRKGGKVTEDMEIEALEKVLAPIRGMAQELANTDEGKIQQLKNAIGDMKEDIGGELLPVVAELASTMKANLPVLRKMFEGFRDIILSLLETVKSHTGEIRFFADAMSDTLKIFAKAPVEIVAFAGAMKTLGPAMGAAKMSAMEAGAAFNVMGKAMRGILKGGLMGLTIWSIGKIAELAKGVKEYVGSELDRIHREDYAREGGEAMNRVHGLQGQQKKLGLTEEQIAAARAKMRNVPVGFDFRNVRDPAVARMFEGLDKKQMDWMSLEFEKRSWRAKADAAYTKMHEVGNNEVVPDSSIDLKKELDIEMAKLTKGDTYNNNITVNNSITTDSDMTAKIIKEQLRVFATSQLNFTSRTAAAKALAL